METPFDKAVAALKEYRECAVAAMNLAPGGSTESKAFSAAFATAYNLSEALVAFDKFVRDVQTMFDRMPTSARVGDLEKLMREARGTLTAVTLTLDGLPYDAERPHLAQLVRDLDGKFAQALHQPETQRGRHQD